MCKWLSGATWHPDILLPPGGALLQEPIHTTNAWVEGSRSGRPTRPFLGEVCIFLLEKIIEIRGGNDPAISVFI